MIRAFQIAGVFDCGLKPSDLGSRHWAPCLLSAAICILCSAFLCFSLSGCANPKEEPIWEKTKIGDLAPSADQTSQAKSVKGIHLEIHLIEIPADNIEDLDKIRKRLRVRPLKLKSYQAFNANSFLARFGQTDVWNDVRSMLIAADGQEVVKVYLMLSDGEPQTLPIAPLSQTQTVFYTAADGSRQGANVGPGILGLRIKGDMVPGRKGICEVTAYPVYSLPTQSAIPKLQAQMKKREFPFTCSALGLRMSPGDFVFLAPKEYVSDQTSLAGLFFSNLRGRVFFNPAKQKTPEPKTAVRVFLLACVRIDD
ncbi:MAG: hypothetical protein AMJ65_04790 [Phycisphaerae bacterium SG8_4]|nr:MAG: hypothetical protein AMJ65_04790 [Phycisphaerae bacterium SG8_4]